MIANKYVKALIARYEAQMAEAEANLSLYLSNNLAAIGEHSDIMEEQDKWIESYSSAKDKLDSLREMLSKNDEEFNQRTILKS
jgi:hypothetical protein